MTYELTFIHSLPAPPTKLERYCDHRCVVWVFGSDISQKTDTDGIMFCSPPTLPEDGTRRRRRSSRHCRPLCSYIYGIFWPLRAISYTNTRPICIYMLHMCNVCTRCLLPNTPTSIWLTCCSVRAAIDNIWLLWLHNTQWSSMWCDCIGRQATSNYADSQCFEESYYRADILIGITSMLIVAHCTSLMLSIILLSLTRLS